MVAADQLNLSIAPGEFLSFLGPSGCGKTTALRMLAGFEAPTSGEVLIDGQVVNTIEPYGRPVNMVFQSYALFPHMNVADNIGYGLRQRRPRLARAEIARKVGRALEIVRLTGFEKRRVWEMSGGQQQRVALARAIVNEPKLLLLDEPLAALDRKLRKEMQIELQDLQRQIGITFVLVTHDQEEALSLSDRICVMREGRIIQTGDPQNLYDHPKSRYVADFVGTSNFIDGRVEHVADGVATLATPSGLRLQGAANAGLKAGDEACLSVRPEQIHMHRDAAPGSLPGTVHNRIFLGEHTEYLVQQPALGSLNVLAPRQGQPDDLSFQTGEPVHINWNPARALVLSPD
ncbi:polyamine-transporting ATPase [Roseibium aquae]|uniref:Polyamine-transporting ATPase n=1 Tax=Roseibium aquae TaxID=1323746 RepID=A0A916TNB6_9HYPH|nr:polyamine-transporting ATPase [Roseibium aquae]